MRNILPAPARYRQKGQGTMGQNGGGSTGYSKLRLLAAEDVIYPGTGCVCVMVASGSRTQILEVVSNLSLLEDNGPAFTAALPNEANLIDPHGLVPGIPHIV